MESTVHEDDSENDGFFCDTNMEMMEYVIENCCAVYDIITAEGRNHRSG